MGSFPTIQLETEGLREDNFFQLNHDGRIANQTPLLQVTEKRLVRALFNEHHTNPGALGRVLDYEVPLQQPDRPHGHGKIDLLCLDEGLLLIVEAKRPQDSSSSLKAVLESYTYTRLARERKSVLARCYDLDETEISLKPVVLAGSRVLRRQLSDRNAPLRRIINRLNHDLLERGIGSMAIYGWEYSPGCHLNQLLEYRDDRIRFAIDQCPNIERLDEFSE